MSAIRNPPSGFVSTIDQQKGFRENRRDSVFQANDPLNHADAHRGPAFGSRSNESPLDEPQSAQQESAHILTHEPSGSCTEVLSGQPPGVSTQALTSETSLRAHNKTQQPTTNHSIANSETLKLLPNKVGADTAGQQPDSSPRGPKDSQTLLLSNTSSTPERPLPRQTALSTPERPLFEETHAKDSNNSTLEAEPDASIQGQQAPTPPVTNVTISVVKYETESDSEVMDRPRELEPKVPLASGPAQAANVLESAQSPPVPVQPPFNGAAFSAQGYASQPVWGYSYPPVFGIPCAGGFAFVPMCVPQQQFPGRQTAPQVPRIESSPVASPLPAQAQPTDTPSPLRSRGSPENSVSQDIQWTPVQSSPVDGLNKRKFPFAQKQGSSMRFIPFDPVSKTCVRKKLVEVPNIGCLSAHPRTSRASRKEYAMKVAERRLERIRNYVPPIASGSGSSESSTSDTTTATLPSVLAQKALVDSVEPATRRMGPVDISGNISRQFSSEHQGSDRPSQSAKRESSDSDKASPDSESENSKRFVVRDGVVLPAPVQPPRKSMAAPSTLPSPEASPPTETRQSSLTEEEADPGYLKSLRSNYAFKRCPNKQDESLCYREIDNFGNMLGPGLMTSGGIVVVPDCRGIRVSRPVHGQRLPLAQLGSDHYLYIAPRLEPDGRWGCPLCPQTLKYAKHCRRHMKNHTQEQMWICETCQKKFGRHDSLRRHVARCREAMERVVIVDYERSPGKRSQRVSGTAQ